MYKILEVEDKVRVPASKMDKELEDAIAESVQEKYEGTLNPETGVVLAVEEVVDVGEGEMVANDGSVYYPAKFKMLVFVPQEHEIVYGEVVDLTDFGAFVRIGPVDALVHISQVMNDYVSHDKKGAILAGKESRRILKVGDLVRARIISVSTQKDNKIGLTMRQPGLGALHWVAIPAKEVAVAKKEHKKEEPKEASA